MDLDNHLSEHNDDHDRLVARMDRARALMAAAEEAKQSATNNNATPTNVPSAEKKPDNANINNGL